MTAMEARADRNSQFIAAVGATMLKRVEQRTVRVLFAMASVACFFTLAGLTPALVWLAIFLVLQSVEIVSFPYGLIRTHRTARAALGLILMNNLVFALYAVLLAMRGGVVGICVAILLLGGALIHAVLASGCSRFTATFAATPPVLVFASLPGVMITHGIKGSEALMLTCAGIMLCAAAFGAWRRLSEEISALNLARQEADRASRAKSDFLTMISHEIRTPLNGVMGMAQSLATDPLTTSQRDRIETLISSGRGLHDMIAEVLDLSRIEAGLLPLDSRSFDLRKVVEGSIEPFSAIANAKGLDLAVSLCPGLAPAYLGDPVRVRQVLHNLISNAIQLTDKGGVLVSASRDAEGVRFSVCDSGPGVPESRLAGIFDRYALLDPSMPRADGGSGLGLSLFMANELVVRMGGAITATNRIPSGLCLTAALPLAVAEAGRIHARSEPEPVDIARALRILAAEDHPVNRKVLSLLLAQIDVVPTMVENGLEAVRACRDGQWDLVLMDIQMPVLDGASAARQIREEARTAGRVPPPIIAVTANVMAHQIQNYLDAGMALCVAKPIDAEVLFGAMQQALDITAPAPLVSAKLQIGMLTD